MTNSPSAYGYLRCSTDAQSDSGLGLAAQRTAITAAAARLGLPLRELHTDAAISGAAPLSERPALSAAIDALRRGDVLIVARRDRLGRDMIEVALIERLVGRKRARIVSAAGEGTDTDDAASILMRRIIDAFAEFERALIRQRTKAALRAKRARGERAGNIPFGFRLSADGVHVERDDTEQRILAVIAELRAAGCPLRRIADALNSENYRTRRGTCWHHQYVAAVIAAPAA